MWHRHPCTRCCCRASLPVIIPSGQWNMDPSHEGAELPREKEEEEGETPSSSHGPCSSTVALCISPMSRSHSDKDVANQT